MAYEKKIVCLANSRKPSGRCVAGIELTTSGFGAWIRPISARPSEELSLDERRYADGADVGILDVVDIRFVQARPHACQCENHVIDATQYWQRVGQVAAADVLPAVAAPGPLWLNGYHSFSGVDDRMPVELADTMTSSLALVVLDKPTISVSPGYTKRQVRVAFQHGSDLYNLMVTDPVVEGQYFPKPNNEYPYDGRMLACISVGEPFNGFRYKLAAALIPL